MDQKNIITCKAKGTSWGVYYLFYVNGQFIESCDESEREKVEQELELKYAS